MIPISEEGDMIKTIIKNQCFTPADSMNQLNQLNRLNRMSTRSNRLQKNLKIWQNVPGRVRNP